jgi:hypothetical protein
VAATGANHAALCLTLSLIPGQHGRQRWHCVLLPGWRCCWGCQSQPLRLLNTHLQQQHAAGQARQAQQGTRLSMLTLSDKRSSEVYALHAQDSNLLSPAVGIAAKNKHHATV